jgi:Leucine-rich repeat (LRR) protein
MSTLKKQILKKIIYFTLLLMTVTEEKAQEDPNQPGSTLYHSERLIKRAGIARDPLCVIFSFLDQKDFLRASHVCKEWREDAYVAGYRYGKSLDLSNRSLDVASCKSLRDIPFSVLILKNYHLGNDEATILSRWTKPIKTLELSFNKKGDEGAKTIVLGNLVKLTSLSLPGSGIRDEGAKAIAKELTALTYLDLSGNEVGVEGAKSISENLNNLASLNLSGNLIVNLGVQALASGKLINLTSLNLSGNNIGDNGAQALASGNLANLTSLNVSFNLIGDDGVKEIARKLKNLTYLNLLDNLIGDKGAKEIAKNLIHLSYLNLSDSSVGDEGARAIAFGKTVKLTSLDLSDSGVGDEGARAIASGNLAALASLNLSATSVGRVGAQALARANFRENEPRFSLQFSRIQE